MTLQETIIEPLVKVINLETTFFTKLGAIKAVDQVSFSIRQGTVLGIVGESGCGKSVTSFSIMRLIEYPGQITGGEVLVGGVDLLKLSPREMEQVRGNKVAMIFQEPMTALNPVMTVGKQISEQILKHFSITPIEAKERGISMLEQVGIPSTEMRYQSYPHQLSGGMRQRAMIAMALSCDPDFLIADEPTTALDVTVQAQILELIQSIQKKKNMTVQFITHDLGVISELADDVLVMYAGRACELVSSEIVFSAPSHPYTQALLGSIPKFGSRAARLPTIEGSVPSPLELPAGCNFQNRCLEAKPICRQEKPTMKEIRDGHFVACFLRE